MESALNWEYKRLVDELSQGMEKAMQLRVQICSTSPCKAQDLLLQGIISAFENALLILKWGGPTVGAPQPTSAAPESSLSADVSPKSENVDISFTVRPGNEDASQKRKSQPTRTEQVRVSSENGLDGPIDDGYSWRKYGQKDILGAKHPRSYYRCTYRSVRNCWATKQVQRSDDDPTLFEIMYKGTHTCSQPSYAVPQATASPQEQENQIFLDFKRAKSLRVETEDLNHVMKNATHFSFPMTFSATERENQYSPLPEYHTGNYSPILYNPDVSESNYLSAVTCQMAEITSGHALSTTNSPLLEFPTDPADADPNFPFYCLDFSRD